MLDDCMRPLGAAGICLFVGSCGSQYGLLLVTVITTSGSSVVGMGRVGTIRRGVKRGGGRDGVNSEEGFPIERGSPNADTLPDREGRGRAQLQE